MITKSIINSIVLITVQTSVLMTVQTSVFITVQTSVLMTVQTSVLMTVQTNLRVLLLLFSLCIHRGRMWKMLLSRNMIDLILHSQRLFC